MFAKSIFLSALLVFGACATKKESAKPSHHHSCKMEKCETNHRCEMFGKKCAMSVAEGNMKVEGKDEYSLVHKGHRYFFSTKDKMEEFRKDADKNAKKAEMNWSRFSGADSRK